MLHFYLRILLSIILRSSIINYPLPLGLITITSSLLILLALLTSITSIIIILIFLIYIGGLIVIFSYFLSLQPNYPTDIWNIIISIPINFIYLLTKQHFTPLSIISYTAASSISLHINKLSILLTLTILLLITLTVINTLLQKKRGPLRPFSY